MIWGETLPSGRERAIETLVDMDPEGSFYRAARVLEESVPQTLSQRPNLVTKSALVEEAYALSKYDLDQLSKYDEVFGEQQNASFSGHLVAMGKDQKDRILRHHAKIMTAKRGMGGNVGLSPSPQLVAALKRLVYGEDGGDSALLRSLLQSVMDHPAFAKDGEDKQSSSQVDDKSQQQQQQQHEISHQLEPLIANICENDTTTNKVHRFNGLLIAILSIVTGHDVNNNPEELKSPVEETDPTVVPPLQVGSLLSVVMPEEDDKNPWCLDPELLSFLGQAAATYEERIEIQKARLMARLDSTKKEAPPETPSDSQIATSTSPPPPPKQKDSNLETPSAESSSTPQPAETPQPASTPDAYAIPEDVNSAAAALSAAVFEQIISAATGEETSSNEDGGRESSGSDSDHDSDYEESERRGLENEESSSSSSSSSSSEADPGEESNQQEQEQQQRETQQQPDMDSEDDDDDMVLRQALALSLVEQSQALRVDTAISAEDTDDVAAPPSSLSSCPVTPGNNTPQSVRDSVGEPESESSPLPAMPTAPQIYPYTDLLVGEKSSDSDEMERDSKYFDPAALKHFSSLPSSHVLVYLLRYTLEMVERRKFQYKDESPVSAQNVKVASTVSGGIGDTLFPPFLKTQKTTDHTKEIGTSLQLLVSLFVLIVDRRIDAIDNLKKSILQEEKSSDSDNNNNGTSDAHGSAEEEGDDPAIALARNLYLAESSSESKESLEAKGMHRKAAAAAHDAAALLESRRRRTESWMQRVKLLSHATLLSMKCLKTFLQWNVRRWIQKRHGTSPVDCQELLPTALISKLSICLASLSSISTFQSLATVLATRDEEAEEMFMSTRLYQDSLLLWGETVPIVYPSPKAQIEVLRSLLSECSKAQIGSHKRPLEALSSVPESDSEPHFHRLQMLCRRLRVCDLLENLVSCPACYVQETDSDSEAESPITETYKEPSRSSSIVSLIASNSKLLGGMTGELRNLYLALCHGCNVRILLWDGIFACTEVETDETAATLTPSPGALRVGSTPSSNLVFDSTKCSDSMAIITSQDGSIPSGGSSVHQRASKVWGTVLSSCCFMPKTGVHRWAVKLDKCERGHVFVGVATAQSSMRTYVGGDKFGWGMIGTQALWHDRRKVRGDYGATFRTGSTIIVTLDTDAGTLSFSSWRDSNSSNSFSLDSLVQNLSSPRRHGNTGGSAEEWGVAFEGLPLDSKLYPAVGLYQRDDKVTLLTVESGPRSSNRDNAVDLSGGSCYYPRLENTTDTDQLVQSQLQHVRDFNDLLSQDGINFVTNTLNHIMDQISSGSDNDFLWTRVLPSLASSLCLVPPNVPILSSRFALALLPQLTKCIKELEAIGGSDRSSHHSLFRTNMQEGKWIIRATGSAGSGSGSGSEEYIVDFSSSKNEDGQILGFEGSGVGTTGKSKNGLVAILGTLKGSSIHFVEEWTDGNDESFLSRSSDESASSCVVSARLSLDGTKFEGTYRNVQFGTTGQIAGFFSGDVKNVASFRLKDAPPASSVNRNSELTSSAVAGEALLCLAHSHLSTIIVEDAAGDHSLFEPQGPDQSCLTSSELKIRQAELKKCLSYPILSNVSELSRQTDFQSLSEFVNTFYGLPSNLKKVDAPDCNLPFVTEEFVRDCVSQAVTDPSPSCCPDDLETKVTNADGKVSFKGSFASLCADDYHRARRSIICVMVFRCGLLDKLNRLIDEEEADGELEAVWKLAVKMLEDGVRHALSQEDSIGNCEKARTACILYQKVCSFLMELLPHGEAIGVDTAGNDLSRLFAAISADSDISILKSEMACSSKRAFLRAIPYYEIFSILDTNGGHGIASQVSIESLAIGIPRLLGRGVVESISKDVLSKDRNHELGGHYLSNLPGLSSAMLFLLTNDVHRMLKALSEIAKRAVPKGIDEKPAPVESQVSTDSMMLSLLACFCLVLQQQDVEFLVFKTDVLTVFKQVFEYHRSSFEQNSLNSDGSSKASVVRDLHEISEREFSRAVLRASLAAAHLTTFQVLRMKGPNSEIAARRCLDLVIGELDAMIPFVDKEKGDPNCDNEKQENLIWDKWTDLLIDQKHPKASSTSRAGDTRSPVGKSGLAYLEENGMLQVSAPHVSPQKPSSRSRGSSANSQYSTETSGKQPGSFCNQFLSHWLHIVVSITKFPLSRGIVADDPHWMKSLFQCVGYEIELSDQGVVTSPGPLEPSVSLPGRYKSRILRILFPLLQSRESSESVVQILFHLSGSASFLFSDFQNDDEGIISREAVSLLRRMHSSADASWRTCIDNIIFNTVDSQGEDEDILKKKAGVLCFLNGGIDLINRGSYVLLKPAAAVPLSVDQQSSPSSKSHSGSSSGSGGSGVSSTPHHVVGNGTESIVAGLCRSDASAGIVSSIDMKNGVCEVVLLDRKFLNQQGSSDGTVQSTFRSRPAGASPKGSQGSRHTLTVRALRSPLSDVVQAQEAPLLVDGCSRIGEALIGLLGDSVNRLSEARNDTQFDSLGSKDAAGVDGFIKSTVDKAGEEYEAKKDDVMRTAFAAMVVRSSISILSDEQTLTSFLKNPKSKEVLSGVLRLAYPESTSSMEATDLLKGVQKKFLSSLALHEARCAHLFSMSHKLSSKLVAIGNTHNSQWNDRVDGFKKRSDELEAAKNQRRDLEKAEGTKTPPPSSKVPDTPPILTSAGTSSETSEMGTSSSRNIETSSNRAVSQSTAGSENSEEDDDSEAAATAAAHLREAAIAQMAELGLPRSWSELALRRTGGTNIEAAVHFCLERGGEMERLLAEERERERMMQRQSSGGSSSRRRSNRGEVGSNHLLRQLLEMGFPSRWCAEALTATGNNVDEALTWILTNGERLSAEDEGMDDGEDDDLDDDDDEDDEDDDEEDEESQDEDSVEILSEGGAEGQPAAGGEKGKDDDAAGATTEDSKSSPSSDIQGWDGSVIPLRFISGRSIIDPRTLAISGLPTGGFSSVGTKGVLLTSGKWYYEAILETAGCLQIGWADGSFAGHCHADRGDGCGDGPSSWAYDGWRRYRWHSTATEWGCRWKEGDVVGCMVDMDNHVVSFTLNGRAEEVGMGVAFSGEGFRPCGGVYACVSFNRREKLKLILGGSTSESFKYNPPDGYLGVGEAVLRAVDERDMLIEKESLLDLHLNSEETPLLDSSSPPPKGKPSKRRFLCDFSDGEHGHELMAWAHRYYGSDASVHLGSNRMKQSGLTKGSSSSTSLSTSEQSLDRRIEQSWKKVARPPFEEEDADGKSQLYEAMKKGLLDVGWKMLGQSLVEVLAVSSLLARKLVLHVMVTSGSNFEPEWCLSSSDEPGLNCALRFWKIIESSSSLRSAGWVGEAGAMAIAAEALGLGISSNDASHSRQAGGERSGLSSIADLDEAVLLPTGSIVQLLSSVLEFNDDDTLRYTGRSLCACAEAAIGSDGGGGVLVFIRSSLEAALCKSEEVRSIFLAAIRRSVRLLAVVEYDSDDSGASENVSVDDDDETDKTQTSTEKSSRATKEVDESDIYSQPDARLISFLSGLFLTPRMEASVENHAEIRASLFEAWSVGLLSASLPWRMVCAFTAAGLLNGCPGALEKVVTSSPTLARFYGRLQSTVARRVWAERAAMPVCSRYSQSMVELLCSVKRAMIGASLPHEFMRYWITPAVDAATPRTLPLLSSTTDNPHDGYWEAEDGWISSDCGWEIWSGSVECLPVDWKAPSRSAVRTLMDGGDGPPMLREGCVVMRGLDWDFGGSNGDEDGKSQYEAEKAKREAEKESANDDPKDKEKDKTNPSTSSPVEETTTNDDGKSSDPTDEDPAKSTDTTTSKNDPDPADAIAPPDPSDPASPTKKKKKKRPSPKLPLGSVVAIEAWKGIPGMGRRVRWHLTGEEKVYRYGGDGGRYDISHVEVNEKETRVKKRHPLPESAEQCAARHGFGVGRRYSVLLRLRRGTVTKEVDGQAIMKLEGIMEWPDFGAGIHVECTTNTDGSLTVTENDLLYGSKDSGWEARFGQPSFVSGTTVSLRAKTSSAVTSQPEMDTKSPYQSLYEELFGTSSFQVQNLRNREDGSTLTVTSELRLLRGRSSASTSSGNVNAPLPPPIEFDRNYHASSLSLSRDGRTVSCVSSDGRGTAFASVGFTKGVHYWEVKLEQADIGSVFIGVAEKPTGSGSGSSYGYDSSPRLNRWHGWGFVNFRATYTAGAERIYGAHCHQGDTVGVLLDCDAGRISFFFDGLKYGEHILNDLGCAFENLSPFGFNVDGCGSGGAGQGAPSGIEGGRSGRYPAQGAVRPRSLWPVIGLRNLGDRVTISSKWNTSYGVDGNVTLKNVLAVDEILQYYSDCKEKSVYPAANEKFSGQRKDVDASRMPDWFLRESFIEYQRWLSKSWCRFASRGSGPFQLASFGLDFDFDSSPYACASASALLGLNYALQAGDRVSLKRSAGRILELAEEAVVLGVYQGRLYYRIVSQKSEGGSLTEGGGRAWCWDESEVVDGLPPVEPVTKIRDIELPFMDRFRFTSPGGLRIVYGGGAVVRSDLEIFDGSINLGLIPVNTVVPKKDVIERRVNSCGVVRYRVRYESMEGWISSRIRGGKEEAIVAPEPSDDPLDELSFPTPQACADKWIKEYDEMFSTDKMGGSDTVNDIDSFATLASKGVIPGVSVADSDSILARAVGAISDFYEEGSALDIKYEELLASISFGIAMNKGTEIVRVTGAPGANQVSASMFGSIDQQLPAVDALMARVALLRAFNRRARLALPWLSIRPCQEGGAVLGGICGHGASIDRAGRYWISDSLSQWVQVPSMSSKLRSLRGLLFTSVKRSLLQSITAVTTTPTPLAHDEYELPREIRTVRINRLKARRVMSGDDIAAKRKHSVFAQLSNETKGWGGAALRRGFVAKGHGGQKRAFKVKLIGEGVNDYSGPYREAFSDAFAEVLNVDGEGRGSLGVLDPTPNNVAEIGENRDLVMFSANGRDVASICKADPSVSDEELRIRESFFSLTAARDETSREVEEALVFMGRLAGTAFRHGIPLDLPLPLESLWKSIVEEMTSEENRLKELDTLSYKQRGDDKSRSPQLWWQQRMLNSFVEGLSNVLPVEVLTVFTGSELRDIVCGNPEVDVNLLHRVVEYEGYKESDDVIHFFWETLREFTNDERKKFLQFVWARNRLPMKETDFDAPFKIQRDTSNKNGTEALPSASTCFFSLALPEYSSQEQMKEKLLFAINNVATMETDFQTNSAEIAEGYRAV